MRFVEVSARRCFTRPPLTSRAPLRGCSARLRDSQYVFGKVKRAHPELSVGQGFHRGNDFLCLDAHPRYALEQVDDFLLVVFEAIGVEFLADCRVFWRLFLILVQNPFEPGAVAEPIIPSQRRHARKLCLAVENDYSVFLVGFQNGFGREAGARGLFVLCIGSLERPWFDCFVADMQRHERFAPIRPAPKILVEGNARKFAFEVLGVFLAITRIMQNGIDVMENRVLGDRTRELFVMRLELVERPIGDVVETNPVGRVAITSETLRRAWHKSVFVWKESRREKRERDTFLYSDCENDIAGQQF